MLRYVLLESMMSLFGTGFSIHGEEISNHGWHLVIIVGKRALTLQQLERRAHSR
jgi:hypothetical protein